MFPPDMHLEVTVDGTQVVGPVTLQLLREGVDGGRVPRDAYARPHGTVQWFPVASYLAAPVAPTLASFDALRPATPAPPPVMTIAAPAPAPSAASPLPSRAGGASKAGQEATAQLRDLEAAIVARRAELQSVEEALDIQSFGFYQPRYGFESSAQYTERLKVIREEQKQALKTGTATKCDAKWTVGGSAAEGQKLIAEQSKLMLRAFNGESDAAIAKVKYDNVINLEQRIEKTFEEINKLGQTKRIQISRAFCDMKLAELRLVHEHREKLQEEKEEQKQVKEQMREEERAQQEIERAQAEAAKEEAVREKALDKARLELAAATANAEQHARLKTIVDELEGKLKEAIERKAKAIARAQLTRSGHVYVLSNLGSFGDGVFKIGMTRRFEPRERVDELGDASVPFPFDVHAMIYCEDAPRLENALHRELAAYRVNLVNQRKEFFRVTLDLIRQAAEKHHGLVTFLLVPEAEEYRKTDAMGRVVPRSVLG